ncbi:hypothetical protein KCH_04880 [Kitasatospora cheerisanensis KCTC 2395]|uniref:Uncharacterized protein n=1 Tax=Kitasatospora cheerisanensis KCTC 2395 TaxID=1348663 RepID=A0A066ZC02_9ACTN|nr:hypothetical protein KCH_04880 [Kitasatospora cheerisanensis KCTC 2395]
MDVPAGVAPGLLHASPDTASPICLTPNTATPRPSFSQYSRSHTVRHIPRTELPHGDGF